MNNQTGINLIDETLRDKWYPILHGEKGKDCALCAYQISKYISFNCSTCVIGKDAKETYCENTPYNIFRHLNHKLCFIKVYELHAEVNAAAQMEIDYLSGLKNKLQEGIDTCTI